MGQGTDLDMRVERIGEPGSNRRRGDPRTFGWRAALALAACALVCLSPALAQAERLAFQRAPIDLKTSSYGGVLQDRDGFIWFSTVGQGVLRYDGYELKQFGQGENGLAGSLTSAIVQDSKGVIWIGSLSAGLTRYDKANGKFTHHRHDPENTNSLSSNNLPFSPRALLVDAADRLWVGTQGGGLNRFDAATSTWTRFRHDPDDTDTPGSDEVLAVAEGRAGQIWIGTKGGGLDRLNPATGEWFHYRHDPTDSASLSDDWINAIVVGRDGAIWIATKSGGLDRFDPHSGAFHHYRHEPENPLSLADDEIWNLYEDRSGNIWVLHSASPLGGLGMLDRKRDIFVRYPVTSPGVSGVSSNGVVGLHQETQTGIIWAINSDGVIDKYDPVAHRFATHKHDPANPKSIGSDAILPLAEDDAGTIWVGTFNAGLNAYDRRSNTFRRFMPDAADPRSIPHVRLSGLRIDHAGTLWIGSWGGTLTQFDPKRGVSLRHFNHDPAQPSSITASERVKYIVEDKDDAAILWIGTIGGGLERFDKRNGTFTHFKHDPRDPHSLSHDSVPTILDDGNGILWITTYGGGLDKFDKNTRRFSHYRHNPKDPRSINSDTLYEAYRDKAGRLWITGKGGISRYDEQSDSFDNHTVADGFPSDIIGSILEDERGILWLGAVDVGLIRFDPNSGAHRLYTEDDGLPSNTFFWTSRLKSRDGRLWFGGSKGLVSFDPGRLTDNPYVPPVRLTAISQGGRVLDLGSAPENAKRIELDWRHNFFEFQFAAPSFSQPERNTYAYKLEGRDQDWYFSGSKPFGRYTGLSGGEYTLRLKAANSSGLWNEDGIAIEVFVRSPFWETAWFYLAVALGIVAGFIFIARYFARLNSEIKRRQRSEAAFRQSEARLSDAQNIARIGSFEWVPDSDTSIWSAQTYRLFGVEQGRQAPSLETILLLVHPDDRRKVEQINQAAINAGTPWDYEYRILHSEKGLRYLHSIGRPVLDDRQQVVRVAGTIQDATERRQAEEELRRLRNYLANIIDSMPSLIIGVDTEGRVTQWNREAQRATGLPPRAVLGQPLHAAVPELCVEMRTLHEAMQSRREQGDPKRVRRHDGETYYEDVTIYPLVANGVEGAVIRIDDVTQRVRMEEMMIQSEKMLSVGGLAAGMAHEINNPLGGIIQTAAVMAERLGGDLSANRRAAETAGTSVQAIRQFMELRQIPRMLDAIEESGRRAATIVNNMLGFARKSDASLSSCDLAQLLDQTVKLAESDYDLKKRYDFKQIEVVREYEPGLPLLPCDSQKIQQVLLNVLTNGAQAMLSMADRQGTNSPLFILRLRHEPDTETLRIEITDNGIGMDDATRKRVFEPFYTTKPVGVGTGLGLSVSYFIVTENHGGEMSVQSQPGEGATFVIRLPLAKADGR